MIDKFVYITILVFLFLLKPDLTEVFSPILNFTFTVIFLFSFVFFLLIHRKYNKNWFRFDVIFLVGFAIVHFQLPFLASIFGIESDNLQVIWSNQQFVNFASWMSVVSIVLWMLGYSLTKNKVIYSNNNQFDFKVNFFIYDMFLLIAFLAFLLTVGPTLYRGEYAGTQIWGDGATYPFLITRLMLYLRIIYFVMSFKDKITVKNLFKSFYKSKVFFVVLFSYTFIFLIVGQRSSVMQIIFVSVGAYTVFIKPISLAKMIFFLFVGAFLFTLISLGRGIDNSGINDGNILVRGYSAYQEVDNKNISNELAGSIKIQYRALEKVPSQYPYLYGLTYFSNIVSVLPFVGSKIINMLEIPRIYQGSSMFFTIIHHGQRPTSGEGSEVLADIYINFGLYGVFIIMFLFGFILKNIYIKASGENFTYIIIFISMLSMALFINRGMLLDPLKDIAYILFLHFVFTRLRIGKRHI